MSQALVVHINGWPGVGKLTVGRALAERISARLIDNHTLLNPAEALFSRRDPLYASLRGEVRKSVLDHIKRADSAMSFVFTDALSDDAYDTAMFEEITAVAMHRNARLVAVVLDCDEPENVNRLTAPGRDYLHKLTDADTLRRLRSTYRLLRATGAPIVVDVTYLTAVETADAIIKQL